MSSLKRQISLASILLLAFGALQAQEPLARLKVRAALVDQNLNIKPIPKLALQLRRLDGPAGVQPIALSTGFDGLAELGVPAGRYQLMTPQPVEFQGKSYAWDLEVRISAPEQTVELSNDNAKISEITSARGGAAEGDLSALFKRLRHCVVTVRSEIGHGTGFIVDPAGLILTNQHVVGPSEYIAVQFDEQRKVAASLLAFDALKDVAVLWANLSAFPEACVTTLAKGQGNQPLIVEGEKVFTIGSPLSQRKILTTGVVSKVEPRGIISDININPGNSGGPLFNSAGQVVGITTYSEQARSGPGLSGIVRIEEADTILAQSRAKMAGTQAPSASLLPVEPLVPYPFETASKTVSDENLDRRPYSFAVGDYEVEVVTPLLIYRVREEKAKAAEKEREKRAKKKGQSEVAPPPSNELKDWAKTAEELKPIITVYASPKLRETGGSMFMRALTRDATPAKLRFKTDFYKMRLLCGEREIQPIHPGKIATLLNVQNMFVNAQDAAYQGFYIYPPDAISPNCGQVSLELYPEKGPTPPTIKVLDPKTVSRVWSDFEPYRNVPASGSGSSPTAPK